MKIPANGPAPQIHVGIEAKKIFFMIERFGARLDISFPHGKGRLDTEKDNVLDISDPALIDHVEFHDVELVQCNSALVIRPKYGRLWRTMDRGKVGDRAVEVAETLQKFLTERKAYWKWDGHAHLAELTSGKLSDCYYNMTPLSEDWHAQQQVGWGLWGALTAGRKDDSLIDALGNGENVWVVGAAMGGVWLATAVQAATGMPSRAAYTEKVEHGRMELKRFDLGEKPYVLLVEDVFTTGSTLQQTIRAIGQKHPDVRFHKDIVVIINRSGESEFRASTYTGTTYKGECMFDLVSLVSVKAQTWDSVDDLPEAMKACTPVRPKGEWEKLATEMLPDR